MPITPIADTTFSGTFDTADVSESPVAVRDPWGPPAHPGIALFGRVLLAAIFVASGFGKLADPTNTATMMTHQGIPYAHSLLYIAAIAEILGGLALVFGLLTRFGAVGLVLYLIPTTLIFHDFWHYEGMEAKMQMANFMKNVAIMGGLFVVTAFGPGRISLDTRLRRQRAIRRARRG